MLSALTGGAPWQTISARLGKYRQTSAVAWFFAINLDRFCLFAFGKPNHCEDALTFYEIIARARNA